MKKPSKTNNFIDALRTRAAAAMARGDSAEAFRLNGVIATTALAAMAGQRSDGPPPGLLPPGGVQHLDKPHDVSKNAPVSVAYKVRAQLSRQRLEALWANDLPRVYELDQAIARADAAAPIGGSH